MENLIATFEYNTLKVEYFYQGTDKLAVKVYLKGELVYEDNTYRPSPMHCIDDDESILGLLPFLTLKEEDTSEEFFETRDCKKLDDWANNHHDSEDISMMMMDFEEKYEDATRITQYIKK